MIEKLFLFALLLLAILSLSVRRLRLAIVYKTLFSLICAFVYLYYSAPDVSIAEAVMGCGIATALFLVALRNAEHFTVYVLMPHAQDPGDGMLLPEGKQIMAEMVSFSKQKNLSLDVRYSNVTLNAMITDYRADLILLQDNGELTLFGLEQDYHFDAVRELVDVHLEKYACTFVRLHEMCDDVTGRMDGHA